MIHLLKIDRMVELSNRERGLTLLDEDRGSIEKRFSNSETFSLLNKEIDGCSIPPADLFTVGDDGTI